MDVGVIKTSKKENEKRVPIHPNHIKDLPASVCRHLYFEKGYGLPFGVSDEQISKLTGNQTMNREELYQNLRAIIIPKPMEEDFNEMREGTFVWGWIHALQQKNITQIAINKKLTLIAWENMYFQGGRNRTHIFQRNNEMAGYCGVQHALQLWGVDGHFGPPRKVVIISFGSVSRGAIISLMGHGFNNITVYTRRPVHLVSDKISVVQYEQFYKNKTGDYVIASVDNEIKPLIDTLVSADIIINGILQNPNDPVLFINNSDIKRFKKECLVIDISCDIEMGFSFAHPSSMSHPISIHGNILYYSVDHTPTLLWDSASWEISNSLIPYLNDFIEQSDNIVLQEATDIKNGVILNDDILTYQKRSTAYPHLVLENQ